MRRLILLSCTFALAAAGFAQADQETEDLLAKMQKAYQSAKTAHIVTKTLLPTDAGELELTIDTKFMAPNKLSSEITGVPGASGPATVKTDGKQIVVAGPQADSGGKVDWTLDAMGRALPVNLETMSFWDWKRQLSTDAEGNMRTSTLKIIKKEAWQGKDWIVLEETAPEQKVFVRYFIDPETYFIHRTRYQRIEGERLIMDAQIVKLELNPKLDEDLFKLSDG